MLGIIRNFIRKLSPILSTDSLRKTPETNPSLSANTRQYIDPVNAPSGIETNQCNRLGFKEGDGRVPDDFNTMGAKEIKNLSLNGR
jgi:hypothetical protein